MSSTDVTAIAEGTRPARQNSLNPETLEALEKRLAQRPERQELQDRNILRARQNSLNTETLEALEKRLAQRPERQDLQDRNILKEGNVAPALQAARDQLQRSQLEDKLDQKLLHRPKPEELVKSGILKADEAPEDF